MGNFFSRIPDPDFDPDSTFSGFSEFFDTLAHIKHLCQRIFEIYQTVDLWTGMHYITSPLCTAGLGTVCEIFRDFEICKIICVTKHFRSTLVNEMILSKQKILHLI